MIPIVVIWTKFTSTISGSVFKCVACENCLTEYVYRLDREAIGSGTSLYYINYEDEKNRSSESADDTLNQLLENDFDPVPCPLCGHYQKFMFPKLDVSTSLVGPFLLALSTLLGCLAAVAGIYWTVTYFNRPMGDSLKIMIASWGVTFVMLMVGFLLNGKQRRDRAKFNPNCGSPNERIALGQARSILKNEFEQAGPGRLLISNSEAISTDHKTMRVGVV